MSTETDHEITITDEVADLGAESLRGWSIADVDLIDAASTVLQAAGPALVAAELRRLADEESRGMAAYLRDGWSETKRAAAQERVDFADRLRQRADELDPPT